MSDEVTGVKVDLEKLKQRAKEVEEVLDAITSAEVSKTHREFPRWKEENQTTLADSLGAEDESARRFQHPQ